MSERSEAGTDCLASSLISALFPPRLQGRATDAKRHRWFEGFDWEALAARKLQAPRQPRQDAAKRIRELAVSWGGGGGGAALGWRACKGIEGGTGSSRHGVHNLHTVTATAAGERAQAADAAQGDARGDCRGGGGVCRFLRAEALPPLRGRAGMWVVAAWRRIAAPAPLETPPPVTWLLLPMFDLCPDSHNLSGSTPFTVCVGHLQVCARGKG